MSEAIIISLVSSLIGLVLVAIVNIVFTRRKTLAETRKLIAEAEKLKAETEKTRIETSKLNSEIEKINRRIDEVELKEIDLKTQVV
jgi:cell division protein FtsB